MRGEGAEPPPPRFGGGVFFLYSFIVHLLFQNWIIACFFSQNMVICNLGSFVNSFQQSFRSTGSSSFLKLSLLSAKFTIIPMIPFRLGSIKLKSQEFLSWRFFYVCDIIFLILLASVRNITSFVVTTDYTTQPQDHSAWRRRGKHTRPNWFDYLIVECWSQSYFYL